VWCSHNDDSHPKEELAKFGYWVIVENFKNLTIFMAKFRKTVLGDFLVAFFNKIVKSLGRVTPDFYLFLFL
jgi:hypothetical protein